MNPFVTSLLKILGGLLGLVFWAAIKWSKERYKLRIIKEAVLEHIKNYAYTKRLLYNENTVDDFMRKNHKQKILFMDEIWMNGLRPIYILVFVQLFYYHNVIIYLIFLLVTALAGFLAEFHVEELKDKKWFQRSLIGFWMVTYLLIAYSENDAKSTAEKQKTEQTTIDSSSVEKEHR